jgi:hypothetical protein
MLACMIGTDLARLIRLGVIELFARGVLTLLMQRLNPACKRLVLHRAQRYRQVHHMFREPAQA